MAAYKLKTGGHILYCLIRGRLLAAAREFRRGPFAGVKAAVQTVWEIVVVLGALVRHRGRQRLARLVHLALRNGASREDLETNPEAAYILADELNLHQRFQDAMNLLEPLLSKFPATAKLRAMRGRALLGMGRYSDALEELDQVAKLNPRLMHDLKFELYRSYLHGLYGDLPQARRAMAAQLIPDNSQPVNSALAHFLYKRIQPYLEPLRLKGRIGVMICDFNNALGHAVLDPFHFVQLHRDQFDHLVIYRPPFAHGSAAMRIAAFMHDAHVEQIESNDIEVLGLAWQYLGNLTHENVTFVVQSYWSLQRAAYQARRDPRHPMSRRRHYLQMPPKLAVRAENILRSAGYDLTRPVVVVHAREHGYHGLTGQNFRNTNIRNYLPALRMLAERGYQVVRIGDKKMTSIRNEVPGLIELQTAEYYDHVLDPYLISRCHFMISCQSGPCSYARAFGRPNLVLNAVYHYSLLPEHMDLLAFKEYRDARSGEPLDVDEIFRAGAHLFDRTERFIDAGIELEDLTAKEILAATEEMLEWLAEPGRGETEYQSTFRERMEWYSKHADLSRSLALPLADYIGYALPECRISDAVCRMRPGFLPAAKQLQAA